MAEGLMNYLEEAPASRNPHREEAATLNQLRQARAEAGRVRRLNCRLAMPAFRNLAPLGSKAAVRYRWTRAAKIQGPRNYRAATRAGPRNRCQARVMRGRTNPRPKEADLLPAWNYPDSREATPILNPLEAKPANRLRLAPNLRERYYPSAGAED